MPADPPARPPAARVPRLRLRGPRVRREREARRDPRRGQPPRARGRGGAQHVPGDDGRRAHALGDARPRVRRERPSADGLHRRRHRPRPQRHRGELPRAEGVTARGWARVLVRDGRRGDHAPRGAPLRRRPRRGGARGIRRARGALRLRRPSPRASAAARRRAAPVPAARGRRRRGDVPRVDGRRVPARHAPDPADRGRRDRRRDA